MRWGIYHKTALQFVVAQQVHFIQHAVFCGKRTSGAGLKLALTDPRAIHLVHFHPVVDHH